MQKAPRTILKRLFLVVALAALWLGAGTAASAQGAEGVGVLQSVDLETGVLVLYDGQRLRVDSRTEIFDAGGERIRLQELPVSTPDESVEVPVYWSATRASSEPLLTRLEVMNAFAD